MSRGMKTTKVTSSHWGAFEVTVEDGRIVGTAPFGPDPDPSPIAEIIPKAVYHKTRVARPSIRKGWLEGRDKDRCGGAEFVELPWDEALDIAAEEIGRVRREHGNGAIFGGSYGWSSAGRFHHAQSQVHRFLNSVGGYVSSYGNYSFAAAMAIMPHVIGMNFRQYAYGYQNSWATIRDNTETLVMFGGINPKNSQVSMGGISRHETKGWCEAFAEKGMRLINIGPQRGDAPPGSEWMPVRPGSDTALMLALAYVLENEGLADHAHLARFATGYDRFRPYLMGDSDGVPKTPEWAAELTGADATAIRNLARHMAKTRTLITVAFALQRGQHGEQPYWMAAVLAAMLGQIGLPGGGVGYGYGALGGVGVSIRAVPGLALPQGDNPIKDFIPVARIADALLHPGEPYDFNGRNAPYPDIRLVYWAGGNPFHHHQDLNRFEEAWRRPETVIVNEPYWTATAKRADIVFPATTPYEREDIGRSFLDPFLFHMPPLIEPEADARDDYDIFADLATRLGKGELFSEGRSSEDWLRHLYSQFRQITAADDIPTPDYDELKEKNWVELPIWGDEHAVTPFDKFREDPDAHPMQTPSGKLEIFSETIASFDYDDCPGHPVWIPPREWLGAADPAAPLHMVSPQPGDKLHSQMESAIADEPDARPVRLEIHPVDATARKINDGEVVRVKNHRGSCLARASFNDGVLKGVVALPTGAWLADGDDPHGNPNVLTHDIGTSRLGQGTSAHTAMVEVETL